MKNELATQNRTLDRGTSSTGTLVPSNPNADNRQIRNISRRGLETLHANPEKEVNTENDLSETAVGKSISFLGDHVTNSITEGKNIVSQGSKGIIDMIKANSGNKNLKGIVLGVAGGLFGLASIKGILGAPKLMTDKEEQAKSAPFIFKAAQWASGAAIALSAFKAFASGGAIMTNPALLTGVAIFAILKMINSNYENENGPIARIMSMLGLRDNAKSLMDETRLNNVRTT